MPEYIPGLIGQSKGTGSMRILFSVPSYWPSQDGVANITEYLAEGLAARGHEVLIFTSAGNGGLQDLPFREEHQGVMIERMRVYVRWPLRLKGRDRQSTRRTYYGRIKSFNPDVLVVVCSQTWTLDWLIPVLNKIECPKVFYSHGYSQWKERYTYKKLLRSRNILGIWEQYLCKRYYDRLYKYIERFDLAIYLSDQNNSAKYAKVHGLANGKVLENAVEDIFVSPEMQHHFDMSGKGVRYLYVANYNDNKNQDMLLKAFCDAEIEDCRLSFIGFEDNEYLQMLNRHLQEWLPKNSSNQVGFYIHLSREEVCKMYQHSDVFVCASKSENCPIVHCEAAAAGMAVISTNVGNVSQMDGILLADNEVQMKEMLERLYRNRNELAERGRRLREYMVSRKCRITDKVDWLEAELRGLMIKG